MTSNHFCSNGIKLTEFLGTMTIIIINVMGVSGPISAIINTGQKTVMAFFFKLMVPCVMNQC